MDNFHCHAVNEVLSFASVLVIPPLRTKDMVAKEGRLAGSTKQLCKTQAHYRFYKRLHHKQQLVPLSAVLLPREPGTSITCPICTTVNKDFLCGNKFLNCDPSRGGCGYEGPRDGGSACSNLVAEVLRVQGPPGRCAVPPLPRRSVAAEHVPQASVTAGLPAVQVLSHARPEHVIKLLLGDSKWLHHHGPHPARLREKCASHSAMCPPRSTCFSRTLTPQD